MLAFWLQVSLAGAVPALKQATSLNQYVHNVWQVEDGLPQSYVTSIVQTRDGYLWLGTQEGLVRFDGTRFEVFDKRNTEQIKDNNIQVLYEDREGTLWLGSEGGLSCLRQGKFTSYGKADGLASDIVEAISEDHDGNLWIGTLAGLSRFKDGVFTNYSKVSGLAGESVLAICEDRQQNLWLGTDGGGLSLLKDDRFTTYTAASGLAGNLVRSLCPDTDGNLWIGTKDGLSRFRDGAFTNYSSGRTTNYGLPSNSVTAIYQDKDRNVWVGTDKGLSLYANGVFTPYTSKNALSDNSVASICEDREGSLWVGTYGGGLNRLKDARFATLTTENGLGDNVARSILEDREGNIWMATRNGLSRLRDGKITTYTTQDGLADNSVLSLCEDSSGALWVGTSSGLTSIVHGQFITYRPKQGLSDGTVLSIVEGRDGALWIGTSAGLNRFENGKFKVYTTADGLTNDSVWAMLVDRQGALWVATDGGGLNRFIDGKFTAVTRKEGLAGDEVYSIYEDADGALWIGTAGGLNRLKDGKLATITSKDGLFDDLIFEMLDDSAGNFWMTCNKGVFRVPKAELDLFAEHRASTILCVSYGVADGMKSRECNGGFQPAGCRSRDGRLWFPTTRGVSVVDPLKIKINRQPPPVVIERVFVDHQPVDVRGLARLEPGKEKFEFHFAGLSFLAPEKVRFKYRLEGFDSDWVDAGTRRDASYTNLRPGSYTFRVIACNNDLVWNETGASFQFRLAPHFYQAYWFYISCAIMLGLLAALLYRLRLRQMRLRFAAVLVERNRIAREIHDTLTQGFVAIGFQLEAVASGLDESAGAHRHLRLAQKMVRTSLDEARRSVWELRAEALERMNLADALETIAREMTAGSDIEIRMQVRGKPRVLPSGVESDLLRVGQESLTNAARHGSPSRISIEIEYNEKSTRLRVADNGCGFDTSKAPSVRSGHFGLVGIRERAEQLGADLRVASVPGEGSVVEIVVPL
jgi:ligand-binding sensor domain-containing protein/signal transduction histidine kinase